jgi:hypothetical protein
MYISSLLMCLESKAEGVVGLEIDAITIVVDNLQVVHIVILRSWHLWG